MEACSFLQGRRQQGWGHLPTFLASLRFRSPLAASVGPSQDLDPPHWLVLPVPGPLLTCSLYSLRLRMTAVICWSMKMRMVTRTAGTADTRQTHHGLAPKGKTIQPRAGFVGCGEQEGHGSCHPLVGCAVQLGDGTSPRCPGWSPTGTQGCHLGSGRASSLILGMQLGRVSHQPSTRTPQLWHSRVLLLDTTSQELGMCP